MAAFRWLITGTPFGNHGRCLVSKDLAPARDQTPDNILALVAGSDFLVSQPESEFLTNETVVLGYSTSNVASINSAVSRHRAWWLSALALSVVRLTWAATQ